MFHASVNLQKIVLIIKPCFLFVRNMNQHIQHIQHHTLYKSPLADDIEPILKRIIRPMIRAFKEGPTKNYMVKLEECLNNVFSACLDLYLTKKANNPPLPCMEALEAEREEIRKYNRIYERLEAQRKASSDYEEKHQIKLRMERDLNVALAPAHLAKIEAKINCLKMYNEALQMMNEKVVKGINDNLAKGGKSLRLRIDIL